VHLSVGQQPTTSLYSQNTSPTGLTGFSLSGGKIFLNVSKMDKNIDFLSFSFLIYPIAVVVLYSLFRGGRPPALNLPDPGLDLTFAFYALHS